MVTDSAGLRKALAAAQPGSVISLADADYHGLFHLAVSGTAAQPITLRAEGHARIIGRLLIEASYWTVRGLDVSDPDNLVNGDGIEVRGSGVELINNVIHDQCNDNGIGAWNTGAGQVYYGNILYRNGCDPEFSAAKNRLLHPHNVYTQNSFEANGYKVFENNLILEEGCANGCNSFVIYTEQNKISGYKFINNVFQSGRVLDGGYSLVSDTIWTGNLFLDGKLDLGYSQWVSDLDFSDNRLFNVTFTMLSGDKAIALKDNHFQNVQMLITTLPLGMTGHLPLSWKSIDANRIGGRFESSVNGAAFTLPVADQPVDSTPLIVQNRYNADLYYVSAPIAATVTLPGMIAVYDPHDFWGEPLLSGVDRVDLPPGVYVVRLTPTSGTNP